MSQRKINSGKGKIQDIKDSLIQINVLAMGFGNLMQLLWMIIKRRKTQDEKQSKKQIKIFTFFNIVFIIMHALFRFIC